MHNVMQMTSADFSNNKLTDITAGLLQLPNLRLLNLSHNKLTHLPDIPVWSATLTHLDLSNNLLTSMPMNITASALTCLNLSKNKLSEVPLCVCTFTKLTSLDVSENPGIRSLPYEMSLLTQLEELNLSGLKRLKEPPKSSVGSVKESISYLRKKFSGYADGIYSIQLMIVGNTSTEIGKRRFASAMYGKELNYNNDVQVCVRDLEYRPNVTKRLLKFRTWIFKALEDYQATHHCLLSQRSLYVLLFNLNDGVDELKPWLKSISHQAPYSALIIVGMSYLDEPDNIRYTDFTMQQAEMAVAAFANNLESLGIITSEIKDLAKIVKSVLNATHQYTTNIFGSVFLGHRDATLHKLCQEGNLKKIKAFVDVFPPQVLGYRLGYRIGAFGYTPLHNAVVSGKPEVLHCLLEKTKNANVNCRANSGYTPLHLAASSGNGKCVKALLEHGADISCVDEYGRTPKQMAERRSQWIIVKLLRSEGEWLIDELQFL